MRNLINCLVIFSFLSLSASAAEDYYVWVDEEGITNYSQQSPQGYDARLVTERIEEEIDLSRGRPQAASAPTTTPANAARQPAPTPTTTPEIDPDALVAEQSAILAAELAETRHSNCEIGKRNLAQLQAFRRVRVKDESGENRILTDEEKAEKTDTARQVIRDNCSG